jgi:hypothetical protein
MSGWKLEPQLTTTRFTDFKKQFKERFPGFSDQTYWRYFTFLHLVGADVRIARDVQRLNIQAFESGKFYSRDTLIQMETKYLTRIARIMDQMDPDDTTLAETAKVVIYRAKMHRQSSRSKRDGKIKNHK